MFRRRFLALGLVASVAACGGGGGSSAPRAALPGVPAPIPTASTGLASAGTAPASFTIAIPRTVTTGAHSRMPRTVPNGTQSIQFTLVQSDSTTAVAGSKTQVYPLTATSPGCSQNSTSGVITCTLQLAAPVGTDIYTADVYGTTDGTGTKLGSGTVKLSVLQNATNSATLSLSGQVASISLGTDNSNYYGYLTAAANVTEGSVTIPTSSRIFVIALDSGGNQVIAPDTYGVPVTLVLGGYSVPLSSRRHSGAAGARHPLAAPSAVASPSSAVIAAATMSVTYAFGPDANTTATSAGTGILTLESPADKITIAGGAVTTETQIFVVPEISGVPAAAPSGNGSSALLFDVIPGVCPSGDLGAPFTCVTPTPTATPCPAGDVGTPGYDCAVPSFIAVTESDTDSGNSYGQGLFQALTGSTASFQFPSLTDPSAPQFTFRTNDPAPTWTVSVTSDTASSSPDPCASLVYSVGGVATSLPLTVTGSASGFQFTAQLPNAVGPYGAVTLPSPSPSTVPLTSALTCGLTLHGNGAGANAVGHLNLYVNHVTGTVQ